MEFPMATDNWEKPRNRGTGLTAEEKDVIRAAFRLGRKAKDVARELKCATRTVHKYYNQVGTEQPPQRVRAPLPDRFYKSNFEL
jgi:hypothetical protein